MPSMFMPSNCSSITLSAVVYPAVGGRAVVPGPDYEAMTGAGGIASAPDLVSADLVTGATTIKMPPNCSSVTINAIPYVPDGNGNIVVPAPAASQYLEELKYAL